MPDDIKVTDLAHALRTPLTVLHYSAQDCEHVDAGQQVDRISDVLDKAQFIAEAQPPEPEEVTTVRLSGALDQAYDFFKDERLYIEPTMVSLRTHESLLEKILIEVLDNALRYSKQDVIVSVHQTPKMITIRVEDFGEGIPQDKLDFIQQPFTSLNKHRVDGKAGNGLGLAYVKKAMWLLDGYLRILPGEDGVTVLLQFKNPSER